MIEVFYQENKIDVQPEQILGTYSLSEGYGSQKIDFKSNGKYQITKSGCFGLFKKDDGFALVGPKSSEELKVVALDYYHQGKIEVAKEITDEIDEKILQRAYRRIK